MSGEKNIDLKSTARGEGPDAAVEAEREANAEPDISTYTPVSYTHLHPSGGSGSGEYP